MTTGHLRSKREHNSIRQEVISAVHGEVSEVSEVELGGSSASESGCTEEETVDDKEEEEEEEEEEFVEVVVEEEEEELVRIFDDKSD